MRLALYGGSFNPPHLGHAAAAMAVCRELRPEKLLILPDNIPPHKDMEPGSPGPRERLELCRLAFRDVPGAEVSDRELRRPGRSYTADTVAALREEFPEAELLLVMGGDMLLSFEQWRRFDEILSQCTLAVLTREPEERKALSACADRLRRQYGARVRLLEQAPLPMSSSQVRQALRRREGRALLDGEVYAAVIRGGWYGALPELDWLREQARQLLTPQRARHTDGCESAAAALARRWGADPDTAAEAAILHDITKSLGKEEQLHLCMKYDTLCAETMRDYPQLLHAVTGAFYARERFGVSGEIAGAVRWHTTGRPDMSLLEKIVYLADVIEPGRAFPGVEELRELAFRDLDAAMALALDRSVEHLRGCGQEVFPDTLAAREWYNRKKE